MCYYILGALNVSEFIITIQFAKCELYDATSSIWEKHYVVYLRYYVLFWSVGR